MLVSSISCATRNCSSSPVSSSHLPAIDAVSLLCRSRPIWVVPALARSFILASVWSGQNARTCIRVCLLFPQVHAGDTPGTPIFASHALSPSTSAEIFQHLNSRSNMHGRVGRRYANYRDACSQISNFSGNVSSFSFSHCLTISSCCFRHWSIMRFGAIWYPNS